MALARTVRIYLRPTPPHCSLMARVTESRGGDADYSSDRRLVTRSGALNLASAAVGASATFVFTFVITRGLGARSASAVFVGIALFSILSSIATFGAPIGLVRTIAQARSLFRVDMIRPTVLAAVGPVAITSTLLGVSLFVTAPAVARLVGIGNIADAVLILRCFAVSLPLDAVCACVLAATRSCGTMRPYVFVENLGKPFFRVAAASVLVGFGWGGLGATIAWIGAIPLGLVWASVSLGSLNRMLERADSVTPHWRGPGVLRAFWGFAAFQGLGAVFQTGVLWLDVLLLGHFARRPGDVAVYSAATRYTVIGTMALAAVILVTSPRIGFLMARDDRTRVRVLYQTGSFWISALALPAYILLFVFASPLMQVFGPAFGRGATPLRILSVAMIVAVATGPVGIVLVMGGKTGWNLANASAAFAVNIGLNLLLIPRFGISGAAIAWSVSIIVQNLAPVVEVRRFWGLQPLSRPGGYAAACAVLVYGGLGVGLRAVIGDSLVALGITLVLGSIGYLGYFLRFPHLLALYGEDGEGGNA
jgi:O-antigen/teichoic acid export membrane protein